MSTPQEKLNSVRFVAQAAGIHRDHLKDTLKNETFVNQSFGPARQNYINRLTEAMNVVAGLKLDESERISERVSDLTLEDSVDLLHAVEDHIRSLRRTARSNFS